MSEYRDLIIFNLILSLLLLVLVIIYSYKDHKRENLENTAVFAGEIVLKTLTEEGEISEINSEHKNNLDQRFFKSLELFKTELQSRKDIYLDLTPYVDRQLSDVFEISEERGSPTVIEDVEEEEVLIDDVGDWGGYDERIIDIDGKKSINVEDLEFDNDGIAYVLYNGAYVELDRRDVPETFSMIRSNPFHYYRYVEHQWNSTKDYIEILFKSQLGGYTKVIKIFVESRKIVGFEVII